ncbi:hypothetical protein TBLA_0A05140 [Henningerozyma blattae CBS 6284]|uniref:Uncharacterized protein n=1 Tax=Henningerozyma blattae (strain ATCC 34711 / CBS 6284 / DSM 70876 / NBRC 10599 / NRRL Y-10934 / UCD 77-7) TaxID=1071380 RepID=I2GW05_HENB6|nr:hypothetical protein TBLA_0A05140 [Tetrapisispora blattae CBS 6284]CCH58307.1 hypothetical protein TBLA_0A05140 [Tetrapisispora blattae CBS 6284]
MSSKDFKIEPNHTNLNAIQQHFDELKMELSKKQQFLEKGTIVTPTTSISSITSLSSKSNQISFWKRKDNKLQNDIFKLQIKITKLERYLEEEKEGSLIQHVKTVAKEINEDSKITVANEIKEKSKITVAREINEDSKITVASEIKEKSKRTVANEIREQTNTTVAAEISGRSNATFSKELRVKSHSNRHTKTVAEELTDISHVSMKRDRTQNSQKSTTPTPIIKSKKTNDKDRSFIIIHSTKFFHIFGKVL